MDVKDYCRSIEVELKGWKTKMYEMVRKVDKLRGADQDKLTAQVDGLHKHIEDIERIVSTLQTECPADFGPHLRPRSRNNMKMQWRLSCSFRSGPVIIAFALFLQSDLTMKSRAPKTVLLFC